MARLIFENVESLEVAKALADWYSGQGEQDAQYWLENDNLTSPTTDRIDVNASKDIVTVHLR